MHTLKDVLLLNSRHNIISEPTRQLALSDPIVLHEDMLPLIQCIIRNLPDISDHCAAYVYLPIEYPVHGTVTQNVWMYKDANCELFDKKLSDFDWLCHRQGSANEACSLFTNVSTELQNCLYPAKQL